jgi:curved DNA-binding protein CbpA
MTKPHEVLGIAEHASAEEVRQRYLVLAQVFHPDRLQYASEAVRFEAVRRMQEVNWAYQQLRGGGDTVYWDTATGPMRCAEG